MRVETRFTREALIALLRCPHFDFSTETGAPSRESIARLNQDLAARRFLGGLDRLLAFDGDGESGAALRASQALGTELARCSSRPMRRSSSAGCSPSSMDT